MSTYTQLLYQIVFTTLNRQKVLDKANREILFKYMAGVLENKRCHLLQINGVDDHIHIVTHIHPTQSLAGLIKDINLSSSQWIKQNQLFPSFKGWQDGYSAFTYFLEAKENLIAYVKEQETHHQTISYRDELRMLLAEHAVPFEEKYFP